MLASVDCPCPYCGEIVELLIDRSVSRQRYTEDCAVCCQPMVVIVVVADANEEPQVRVEREAD
jgi:hypothetical protein